jgi:hypothetical protein
MALSAVVGNFFLSFFSHFHSFLIAIKLMLSLRGAKKGVKRTAAAAAAFSFNMIVNLLKIKNFFLPHFLNKQKHFYYQHQQRARDRDARMGEKEKGFLVPFENYCCRRGMLVMAVVLITE